jgi:hypothetical protein
MLVGMVKASPSVIKSPTQFSLVTGLFVQSGRSCSLLKIRQAASFVAVATGHRSATFLKLFNQK